MRFILRIALCFAFLCTSVHAETYRIGAKQELKFVDAKGETHTKGLGTLVEVPEPNNRYPLEVRIDGVEYRTSPVFFYEGVEPVQTPRAFELTGDLQFEKRTPSGTEVKVFGHGTRVRMIHEYDGWPVEVEIDGENYFASPLYFYRGAVEVGPEAEEITRAEQKEVEEAIEAAEHELKQLPQRIDPPQTFCGEDHTKFLIITEGDHPYSKKDGTFHARSVEQSCSAFNQEICAAFKKASRALPRDLKIFYFLKAIIHKESNHDPMAFRFENAGMRRSRWARGEFASYMSQAFNGKSPILSPDPRVRKFEASFGLGQVLYPFDYGYYGFRGRPEELFEPTIGLKFSMLHLVQKMKAAERHTSSRGIQLDLAAAAYNSGSIQFSQGKPVAYPGYIESIRRYRQEFKDACRFRSVRQACGAK